VLRDLDLELQIARLKQRRAVQAAQTGRIGAAAVRRSAGAGSNPQAREALKSTEEQLAGPSGRSTAAHFARALRRLRAAAPQRSQRKTREGQLQRWTGIALDESNLGCRLDSQVLLCRIGDPRRLEAALVVDQAEVEFVQEGMSVDMKLDELPDLAFTGVY